MSVYILYIPQLTHARVIIKTRDRRAIRSAWQGPHRLELHGLYNRQQVSEQPHVGGSRSLSLDDVFFASLKQWDSIVCMSVLQTVLKRTVRKRRQTERRLDGTSSFGETGHRVVDGVGRSLQPFGSNVGDLRLPLTNAETYQLCVKISLTSRRSVEAPGLDPGKNLRLP